MREDLLRLVRRHPGATVRTLRWRAGLPAPRVYAALRELERAGAVRRVRGGRRPRWYPL